MALALTAGNMMAVQQLKHYGKVGISSVHEDDGNVQCNYGVADDFLQSINVDPPDIYARDRTAGVDQQQVGWQIIVRRKLDSQSKFHTVLKSTIAKTTTSDDTPAPFKARQVTPFVPDNSRFVIIIKSFWFRPDGSVAGWAKARVERYTEDDTVHHYWPVDYCNDRYLF
jgi:hypothetical protein